MVIDLIDKKEEIMDLTKLNKSEAPEDRPIESAKLLSEEKEVVKPQEQVRAVPSRTKVGRPSTKKAGVIYKKAWYDLPEDLLKEAKKYQVVNDYPTNSKLIEAALSKFINYR